MTRGRAAAAVLGLLVVAAVAAPWLGHATLPYAMRLAGLTPVEVHCALTSSDGDVWTFGPPDAAASIRGSVGAFCRVGARRLSAADSGLVAVGPSAFDALVVLRNYAA